MKPSAVTAAALVLAALAFAAPAVAAPGDVLYDQFDHAGTVASGSQDFEGALDSYDDQAADDFAVPSGPGWNVTGVEVQGEYFNGPGPASSVNVAVYADAGGLPGTLVASRPNQSFTGDPNFVVTLDPSIGLLEGSYWISVQANQTFASTGQWAWLNRTEQSTAPAAWQNPGGGLGMGCTAWAIRATCIGDDTAPDQVFRLTGTIGAPPPPPPPPPPPVRCRVPRVIGLRLAAAKTRLRRAHCGAGRVTRRVSPRRVGRVLAQSPAPRAVKRRGFPVRLVVGRR